MYRSASSLWYKVSGNWKESGPYSASSEWKESEVAIQNQCDITSSTYMVQNCLDIRPGHTLR